MKIIAKILKWLVILILLLILGAALTVLAWYKGWPLFTGAVVVAGIAALWLVGKGLLALWRWRNKKAFVSRVMSEDTSAPDDVSVGEVTAAWNRGIECVRNSPSRFTRRLRQTQPWFVTLEEGTKEVSPFDAFGRRVPEEAGSPLYWHFLPTCVVLRCSFADVPQDWEAVLQELAANRSRAPLRGIILSLRLSLIQNMSDSELVALGIRLRTRVQQIMMTGNADYPVYILAEDLESLPGMAAVLSQVIAETSEGLLGGWCASPEDGLGVWAAEHAAEKLEESLLDAAADGLLPRGDQLTALNSLRAIGPKLEIVTESLSRELSHQVSPKIAGIYFCSQRAVGQGARRRPAFVSDLTSKILPAVPQPRPFTGMPIAAGAKIALMGGWLLLTLCVCGLLAAGTIYQYRILEHTADFERGNPAVGVADLPSGRLTTEYARLYSEMNSILKIERAHSAWYLPRMGEDMLGRVMKAQKRRYVQDVNRLVLAPMINQFRAILASPPSASDSAQNMDLAVELLWLASALSDRLDGTYLKSDSAETSNTFPLTTLNEEEWTPVTGWLITNALRWLDSSDYVEMLLKEMQSLLAQSFTRRGSHLLQNLMAQMNQAHELGSVALSQFWRHVPSRSPGDLRVEYCYTAEGCKRITEAVADIREIAGDSDTLRTYLDNFKTEYLTRYADAWENFARGFAEAGASMEHGGDAAYQTYEDISKVSDLPHVKAYRRFAAEIEPLCENSFGRDWVNRIGQIDAVVSLALEEHESPGRSRLWNVMSALETNPRLLTSLREGVRGVRPSDIQKAAASMRNFFDGCLKLIDTFTDPAAAFAFCSAQYGQTKGVPAVEGISWDGLREDFEKAFGSDEWSPAREILEGILDFAAAEATIMTARILQIRWEEEVLNNPVVIYGRGGGEAVFGPEGVVTAFVQKNLLPFVTRRGGQIVPSVWNGTPFPFEGEFLNALISGEIAASQPEPPAPKETYSVEINTRPPLVHPDARVRPVMMTLTLEGDDGPQQIINQNFPQTAVFTYSPKKSGRVVLTVSFPGFDLTHEYSDFKEFADDFRIGEKTFRALDFPAGGRQMLSAGISQVKIPILAAGTAGIFDDPEAGKPQYPELPYNITRLVTHR